MSNSPLVTYTNISNNKSSPRNHKIDRITIHCLVAQWTAKQGCDYFKNTDRDCSANYVVGVDGSIGLSVDEADRSWCSSSSSNDNRAITIETASDKTRPYAVTYNAYESLIKLIVDICKRNGISKLIWFGDKNKSLSYEPKDGEAVMTVHRWFANKSCPGDYLYSRHGEIATLVNECLTRYKTEKETKGMLYKVQVGAYGIKANAEAMLRNLKECGFDGFIVEVDDKIKESVAPAKKSNETIAKEVINGDWGNGQYRKDKLTEYGYDYNAIQTLVNKLIF